ncbi:(2Fe-2S)-binding protein [Streptomyces sp. NPDC006529]|uniref:(2Fe-2S)-binding protein n=1 Tax=Streptomyces sp. NPDC006529 TaxID=3157177 RepID=UPI0033A45D04
MSENENASDGVGDDGTGNDGAGTAWGWEPVPHGGEYDSDATAFVQLPPDMMGAAGTGEPLAAPGHGFVPPPMIVPLGSAGTDPAATGTWTLPVRWPEAGGSAPAEPAPRAQSAPAPVLGPIPAVIPMPASAIASLQGETDQGFGGDGAAGTGAAPGYEHAYEYGHESASTAEWRFPETAENLDDPYAHGNGHAAGGDQSGHTGQFALSTQDTHGSQDTHGQQDAHGSQDTHGTHGGQTGQWAVPVVDGELPRESGEFRHGGGPEADWSRAPATLPGGAAAPWATQPGHGHTAAEGFAEQPAESGAEAGADSGDSAGAGAIAGAQGTPSAFDAFGALDPEQTMSAGVLPAVGPDLGPDTGDGSGRRVLGGPGVGTPAPLPYGPRVIGGPGVGTPLPEHLRHLEHPDHFDHAAHGEGAPQGAPDIDAAHGAAAAPVASERPHPAADPAAPERTPGFAGADGAPGGAEGEHRETGTASGDGDAADVPDEWAAYDGGEGTGGSAEASGAGPEAGPEAGSASAPVDPVVPVPPVPAPVEAEVPVLAEAPLPVHEEHPLASYVLRVNGADRPVTGAWIGESLLYVLRERLGLAGAKDGCSQGECGACAVQVDGRLVASCLVPAATAASSEVRTVEGLATDGELSDVQQALCRSGAVQCGFCVPGMAMTIHDLLEGNHAPSELETRQALCGNLCRCSGYRGVIDAVGEVVAEREAAAEAAAAGPHGDAQGGAEARIPHQAAPGEGGIHPDHQHGGMA